MKLHRNFGELFTPGGVPVLAVRANLLVIAGLTMSAEVILHLVPVLHVVSMSLTGRADGQKVLQYAFVHEGILERDKFSAKGGLQIQDALSYSHAGAKLFRIERLGDVIVRSRVQTGNDVSHAIPGGQQNNVSSRSLARAAYFAAKLGTAKTGHHPIENSQFGWVGTL